MKWKEDAFSIILPDPYNPDAAWHNVALFTNKEEALAFVAEHLGGDEKGKIDLISHVPDVGWLVDVPNPQDPGGPWIFVESFDLKREAIDFVKQVYYTDSKGRLQAIDIMYSGEEEPERGPRDWSPRWKTEREKRK